MYTDICKSSTHICTHVCIYASIYAYMRSHMLWLKKLAQETQVISLRGASISVFRAILPFLFTMAGDGKKEEEFIGHDGVDRSKRAWKKYQMQLNNQEAKA